MLLAIALDLEYDRPPLYYLGNAEVVILGHIEYGARLVDDFLDSELSWLRIS